jgi:histidine triad (HIT) family protein
MEDCIFCKIAKGEVEANVIYENDNFIVFPDLNPRVEGHCLIIPKKHFSTILDLPQSLGKELMEVVKGVAEIKLKEGAEGFNIVQNNGKVAGQVVGHIHFHFLPRKKGDNFKVNL